MKNLANQVEAKLEQVTSLTIPQEKMSEYCDLSQKGKYGQVVFNVDFFLSEENTESIESLFTDFIVDDYMVDEEENEVRLYGYSSQFDGDPQRNHTPEYLVDFCKTNYGTSVLSYVEFTAK